jgi:flavin-dependent dehydrogenase
LGAYLARAGVSHLILDQAVHPRRHVGESLVCSTNRIFQEIDFLSVMEREKFVHKHGAVWTHWANSQEQIIRFRELPDLGLTQNYAYHVDRSRFDQLLLQHAARLGSRVWEGTRVDRVDFDPDGSASGVRVTRNGQTSQLRSRLVIDASGRQTLLGSQLKLKHHDPLFDQFAVHNWFENVNRGSTETADFIHVHVLDLPRAWVWLIPINDKITSVGIVTKTRDFPRDEPSLKAFFDEHINKHPILSRRMAHARPLYPFSREANYSYVMDRFAGDGWLLLGDAARFVDPVFSSGVSVAMESARRAAPAILEALRRQNVKAESFDEYEKCVRAGIDIWRGFIMLYYALPPAFLDLLSRPEARSQITRLLQGDVYDRASVPVLEEMRALVNKVKSEPAHQWHAQLSLDARERS